MRRWWSNVGSPRRRWWAKEQALYCELARAVFETEPLENRHEISVGVGRKARWPARADRIQDKEDCLAAPRGICGGRIDFRDRAGFKLSAIERRRNRHARTSGLCHW